MEWVVVATLIIGVFIFSFGGVIYLIKKTKAQQESINELRRKVEGLLNTPRKSTEQVAPDAVTVPPDLTTETIAPDQPVDRVAHDVTTELIAADITTPAAAPPVIQNRLIDAFKSFIKVRFMFLILPEICEFVNFILY